MGDDWRWREIMETNFEMIDINAIKPESVLSRDSSPTKDIGTTVDKTMIPV